MEDGSISYSKKIYGKGGALTCHKVILLVRVLVLERRLVRELLARDVLALGEHLLVGLVAVREDRHALVDGVVGRREVVGALRRPVWS